MYRLRPKAFGRLNCLALLILSTLASAERTVSVAWLQQTPSLFSMEQNANGSDTCSNDFYFAPTHVANQLPDGVPDSLASSQSSSYVPLSGQQKFALFLKRSYAPTIFTSAAFDATYSHLIHDWPAYGQGADGFGKRYGA